MDGTISTGGAFNLVRVLNIYRSESLTDNIYSQVSAGPRPYYIETQPILDGRKLGPASPLTQEELGEIMVGMTQHTAFGSGFIPPEILAYRPGITGEASYVIWCKPGTMRLRHTELEQPLTVPYPGLLLAVEGDSRLSVFAVKDKTRPTPKAALYKAPFWNMVGGGEGVCIGNCRPPSRSATLEEKVKGWRAIWFDSTFSHPLSTKYGKKSLGDLWVKLEGKKEFPAEKLIASNLTLAGFLKQADF